MPSPTSSATSFDSSRSGSPDTRATTPSSVLGVSSILSLPSIYVYFVGASFTAASLEETFKEHACENRMGIIIDQNSVDQVNKTFICKGEWMPFSLLSHGNGGSTINYFISTTVTLEDQAHPVGLIYHITRLPLIPICSTGHSLRRHESFASKSRKHILSLFSSIHMFSPLDNTLDPPYFRKISLCLPTSLVHYRP